MRGFTLRDYGLTLVRGARAPGIDRQADWLGTYLHAHPVA